MGIGDIVVCINDVKLAHTEQELSKDVINWVVKGERYTIRGFHDNDGIVTGVLLEEIHNRPIYFKLIDKVQEPAFRLDRFRKIESKPIEIESYEYSAGRS